MWTERANMANSSLAGSSCRTDKKLAVTTRVLGLMRAQRVVPVKGNRTPQHSRGARPVFQLFSKVAAMHELTCEDIPSSDLCGLYRVQVLGAVRLELGLPTRMWYSAKWPPWVWTFRPLQEREIWKYDIASLQQTHLIDPPRVGGLESSPLRPLGPSGYDCADVHNSKCKVRTSKICPFSTGLLTGFLKSIET